MCVDRMRGKQGKSGQNHMSRLPPNVARGVLAHLPEQNRRRAAASVRTAGRSTRNFGREGFECSSERTERGLRIQGTAVSLAGARVPFAMTVRPVGTYSRFNDHIEFEMKVFVYSPGNNRVFGAGRAKIRSNEVVWDWSLRPPAPEIREQIMACLARQASREAAYLVQSYVEAVNSMVVSSAPHTVTQLRAALAHPRGLGA